MTSRFIQLSYETTDFSDVLEYLHCPVLSLEQALRPVSNRLHALDDRIKRAKKYCCHSPSSDLTRDECGALDLYAEDRGEQSLHYALNKAIRSRHRSEVKLWFGYLKLLQVALEKIPNLSITVWCGMSCHLANNLRENQEIVWWNVTSCTSSYDAINGLRHDYSVLCSIESLTGKNVYRYTGRINQSEVLFLPGTRLRVKSKVHNRDLHELAIHLVEIVNDTPARPMPMVASSSSSKKSSGID